MTWPVVLLDSVTERGSGHTPSQKHPEYWNGGIKWVSLADSSALDNRYIFDTAKKISALGLRHSSAVLHPKGTVIVSRDAGVGKSAILGEEMAVSQHFIAWRCDGKRLCGEYLYQWLQSEKSEFERIAAGSTVKTIGLGHFQKLHLPMPPLQVQKNIARVLDIWDTAIQTTEQLTATKEQQYVALSGQLLFGLTRLKKYGTSSESKSLHWFSMSSEWSIVEIGQIAREVSAVNGTTDDLPVLSCTKYDGLVDSLQYFSKQVFSYDTSK